MWWGARCGVGVMSGLASPGCGRAEREGVERQRTGGRVEGMGWKIGVKERWEKEWKGRKEEEMGWKEGRRDGMQGREWTEGEKKRWNRGRVEGMGWREGKKRLDEGRIKWKVEEIGG